VFLLGILASFLPKAKAQNIPIGTWRTHASYQSIHTLALAGEKIYAGTTGSFFVFDQAYAHTTTLSRIDGFSSVEISRLAFEPQSGTVIIAYRNGSIDLLHDNEITNLNTIAEANITTGKQANHLLLNGTTAYISSDFGLVVVDLVSRDIKETYRNIGTGGTPLAIYSSTIVANQFFLATSAGILTAPVSGKNLLDFKSWRLLGMAEGLPEGPAKAVAALNGNVYAGFENAGIFTLTSNRWQLLDIPFVPKIYALSASRQQIFVCIPDKIYVIEPNGTATALGHPLIKEPQEVGADEAGHIWIADAQNGLLSNYEGSFRAYIPNGPVSNSVARLQNWNDQLVALPAGYDESYAPLQNQSGFSVFTTTGWENYTSDAAQAGLQIPVAKNWITSVYNPVEKSVYVGSYGDGLLMGKPEGSYTVFNAVNSPLQATQESGGGVRVTGLAVDVTGNTWVTNYGVAPGQAPLHLKKTDGTWQSFLHTNAVARHPLDIVIDDSGYKWIRLVPGKEGGILVFDEKANRSKYLTTTLGQGGLPDNNVYSLVKDKDGQIWAGTGRGVTIFLNPDAVFSNPAFDAFAPVYESRPLLRDEVVTCIEVDGGNRKWIGTRNGIWLFSPSGDELLAHFTTQNSPLPSDYIRDISIQLVSGEVFMATDEGLVSYRGTATEGESVHTGVKVFPNPVRPDFDGLIGISGLVNNAIVKITDVSGRLLYETRANGGTATWNVRDYTGRRASTGIYLIFSADPNGQEALVTKIAIIE
jgi:hypothetical protein